MKQLITALALLLASATSLAGLVSVNTSNYIRESGSAVTETLSITLENEGEIRIANVNLQDDAIEVAASTEVYLNGQPVLDPFYLPPGGSVVFPLEAGVHDLEVTVLGKPGGGIAVSFYENKPDAPVQGKGWELLDDGTVLHRKTGLIWHQNTATPGLGAVPDNRGRVKGMGAGDYIVRLNQGNYGDDPVEGNAGHGDWRVPTAAELRSVVDLRFAEPAIANSEGEGTIYDPLRGGHMGGMKFAKPLMICPTNLFGYTAGNECDDSATRVRFGAEDHYSSTEWNPWGYTQPYNWQMQFYEGTIRYTSADGENDKVWPVRGGPAN
jgi:hypothetical protein